MKGGEVYTDRTMRSRLADERVGPVRGFSLRLVGALLMAVAVSACTHEEHMERISSVAHSSPNSSPEASGRDPSARVPAEETCSEDGDCGGFRCCAGRCVNVANDPHNCGGCGGTCGGEFPYCAGKCTARPCSVDCGNDETCCGARCCGVGEICCMRTFGPSSPECIAAQHGTCPRGCPGCE